MWLLCHPSINWIQTWIWDYFGFGFGYKGTGFGLGLDNKFLVEKEERYGLYKFSKTYFLKYVQEKSQKVKGDFKDMNKSRNWTLNWDPQWKFWRLRPGKWTRFVTRSALRFSPANSRSMRVATRPNIIWEISSLIVISSDLIPPFFQTINLPLYPSFVDQVLRWFSARECCWRCWCR